MGASLFTYELRSSALTLVMMIEAESDTKHHDISSLVMSFFDVVLTPFYVVASPMMMLSGS